MKSRPDRPNQYLRQRRSPWRVTLGAAAFLFMWLAPPTRAFVIDDFEHGRQFMLWGPSGGQPEWQIDDGQMKIQLPTPGSFAALVYEPLFELPDGQPVEFRVDAVTPLSGDAFVFLVVHFSGQVMLKNPGRGYVLDFFRNRVVLGKEWDGASGLFFDASMSPIDQPHTASLTLTREGGNMRILAKIVSRDNPQAVLFSRETVDRPGQDMDGDNGPPPSNPVETVNLAYGAPAHAPGAEMVFDNLVCSLEQALARLSIQPQGATQAVLAWSGEYIPLESASVRGPWRPCAEQMTPREGGYRCTVPLADSARYFRLAKGYQMFDTFEGGTSSPWQTTSVVPEGTSKPLWSIVSSQSRGRILGVETRNVDFMLRHGHGLWFTDCVATVDIVGWGEAMDGATFGILLRARPEPDYGIWYETTAGLPEERYTGLLTFKQADNPTESGLSVTGPSGAVLKAERFPALSPEKAYRLRFWAVGDRLTLELFDLAEPGTPIRACAVTDGRIADGMHGLYGTKSAGGTYEVWIGQFLASGVTVY